MDNRYGKTSKLDLTMEYRDDKTILSDVFFTAPFKIIKPFYDKDYMQVMQISVSAGIMDGDKQEISIKALENSKSEIISQAYEKIHKMENGFAQRSIEIEIDANSQLIYNPLPVIPFKNSAFKNSLSVNLKDSSSKFILNEILTCGRVYSGEKFEYKFYNSRVCVRENGRLVFMDNSRYSPDRTDMSNIGMYEGYTHLFNFVVFNYETVFSMLSDILSLATPFYIAIIIAFVLNIPMRNIEHLYGKKIKRHGLKRGISIATTLLLAIILIILFSSFIIPRLGESIALIITNIFNFI